MDLFRNLSLRKKIFAFNVFMSAFLLAAVGASYWGAKRAVESYRGIVEVEHRLSQSIGAMESTKSEMFNHYLRLAYADLGSEEGRAAVTRLTALKEIYMKNSEAFDELVPEIKEARLKAAVDEKWRQVLSLSEKILAARGLRGGEGPSEISPERLESVRAAFDETFQLFRQAHAEDIRKRIQQAESRAEVAQGISILALITGLLTSFASAMIAGQMVSRRISSIADRLSASSSEALTESVKVSSASTQLASAMAEQAAAIQQTVSAVHEISVMVARTEDNSEQSRQEAARMNDVAERGRKALEQVLESISGMADGGRQMQAQIENSQAQMEKIVDLISQIGSKTKIINDIVFQTKLLSFNASVEAARAGEHGKGFAVVAEEVGNLAEMSGNAAKEISELLEKSTHEVRRIVTESKSSVSYQMERSQETLASSRQVAKECSETFEQIISQVGAVSRNIDDIAGASHEQSAGIREITRVMNTLGEATRQNSTTTTETADAARVLRKQAGHVRELVGELMTIVVGSEKAHAFIRKGEEAGREDVGLRTEKIREASRFLKESQEGLLLQLARKNREETPASEVPQGTGALVAGSDIQSIPSADDERFEKI